jgi:hypothetical protein
MAHRKIMRRVLSLQLRAPNDNSGNPRRGFLVLDNNNGRTLAFIDEGYNGNAGLRRDFPRVVEAGSIEIPTSEYRAHMRADYARHS